MTSINRKNPNQQTVIKVKLNFINGFSAPEFSRNVELKFSETEQFRIKCVKVHIHLIELIRAFCARTKIQNFHISEQIQNKRNNQRKVKYFNYGMRTIYTEWTECRWNEYRAE